MSTREDIITTAEVLFARDGYAGTSLRQITDQAGANIAAVNYHFGSKENLLIEILDRVITPITTERLELLDAAESAPEPPDVPAVLTAFLLPDLHAIGRLRQRDPELPRFVARMYTEGSDLMASIVGRQFAENQRRFVTALAAALPHLGRDEILWRLRCLVGIIVYLFAGVGDTSGPPMLSNRTEADLDRLLAIAVPLMTAPDKGGDR